MGIVVPCEGIDQRTEDAAGKACYGTLTHCVMLEDHTCHRDPQGILMVYPT